ncbi:hypothetical protein TNCV_814101 [Trichonephila clavipes]|nr:hypothetical protein TNCV_814101 [Trichonephila clavipes]
MISLQDETLREIPIRSEGIVLRIFPCGQDWIDKMSTKLAWELNTGGSPQTDYLTGTSAHAPQSPWSRILSWAL